MKEQLKNEVAWAADILNPRTGFKYAKECKQATAILHPSTQMKALSEMGEWERKKAVNNACLIASNALDYFITKEDVMFAELVKHVGREKATTILADIERETIKRI